MTAGGRKGGLVCSQRFIRGPAGERQDRPRAHGDPSAKLCTFNNSGDEITPLRDGIIFEIHLNELRENSAQQSE